MYGSKNYAALKETGKKWFNTQGLFINVLFKLIVEAHVATKHEINAFTVFEKLTRKSIKKYYSAGNDECIV